jgi:VWFA-related protein
MPRRRSFLFPILFLLPFAGTLRAQESVPADADTPVTTLRETVRNVLVDVVVTDKSGHAVPGLKKEDFKVFEDGKPQSVSFFEDHSEGGAGSSNSADAAAIVRPMPLNTFTNVPAIVPSDTVNLLLMDALNTQESDQVYVHKEMVKYLNSIPPGIRMSIFLLSEKLRIIQGFTQDSTVLRASIARLAANPSTSALLPTSQGAASETDAVNMIVQQGLDNRSTMLADTGAALQQFLDQSSKFQVNERTVMTLEALQVMARYLNGVPGRKNLIWFVGSIPLCLPFGVDGAGSITSGGCPYDQELKKTINMLAEARVSIYPIQAAGLAPEKLYDASAAPGHPDNYQALITSQVSGLAADSSARNSGDIVMDKWAAATGGRAITNRNGLKEALAEDIENGSRYYSIAYNPTNREEIGKERKIEIKLPSGNYKLAYRRSYFEQTAKEARAAESAPGKDPLRPMMDRGMPDFTELRFRMRVAYVDPQPAADAPRVGDNPALKAPANRYRVIFALNTKGLSLTPSADGVRRGNVEVALVAYDQQGKVLNWVVRSIGLAIKPEQNAVAENSGIPFHFDLDVPPGEVYLRTGVYDLTSNRAGTLEIPMSEVRVAAK